MKALYGQIPCQTISVSCRDLPKTEFFKNPIFFENQIFRKLNFQKPNFRKPNFWNTKFFKNGTFHPSRITWSSTRPLMWVIPFSQKFALTWVKLNKRCDWTWFCQGSPPLYESCAIDICCAIPIYSFPVRLLSGFLFPRITSSRIRIVESWRE